MKRIGFTFKVKQEKLAEYKAHHQAVWPEMLEALRRTGWHNYSIFACKDGVLFGYFEADESLQTSQAAMAKEPINLKWQKFMEPYFEELGGSRVDETMVELEQYFHLD